MVDQARGPDGGSNARGQRREALSAARGRRRVPWERVFYSFPIRIGPFERSARSGLRVARPLRSG